MTLSFAQCLICALNGKCVGTSNFIDFKYSFTENVYKVFELIAPILSPMTINHQTIAEFSKIKLMMQCLFDAVNRAENPSVLVWPYYFEGYVFV